MLSQQGARGKEAKEERVYRIETRDERSVGLRSVGFASLERAAKIRPSALLVVVCWCRNALEHMRKNVQLLHMPRWPG